MRFQAFDGFSNEFEVLHRLRPRRGRHQGHAWPVQRQSIALEELHRFPSAAVRLVGSLRWNVLHIWEELKMILLEETEQLTGHVAARLHVVGGGSQNSVLNQFACNAPASAGHRVGRDDRYWQLDDTSNRAWRPRVTAGLRNCARYSFALKFCEPIEARAWQGAMIQ
ncbi:MAG: hypothetical protein JO076_09145 [Verrucomicrobia bacterium]|nr:hypothetical protein [Verrucomicrobiota bacterium]